MIFIDSNIPMYIIGAEHPHKIDARRLLEEAVVSETIGPGCHSYRGDAAL